MALLLQHGVASQGVSLFDYGCGHGHDIEILGQQGFSIGGYDPYFRPDGAVHEAEVVNLGYVLNVIESPTERTSVLKKAFTLAQRVLCVSVMTTIQKGYEGEAYADGVLSKRRTFQKFFEQEEIKEYLESNLDRPATPLEPGIFLVFREESERLSFLESRISRRKLAMIFPELARPERPDREPRQTFVDRVRSFTDIDAILDFISRHGRVPVTGECVPFDTLTTEIGQSSRVTAALTSLIAPEDLEACRSKRKEDLEVIYATRRFDKRGYPKPTDVPLATMADIKAFYGSYKAFLDQATKLLFSLGSDDAVTKAFSKCKLGKHLPDAVYVHTSVIPILPAPIRVLIGVAESLLGLPAECNILKLNKVKRKISFMAYEDFDAVAHPALLSTYVVDVPKNEVKFWNFADRDNPPILHRKETFVAADYPNYAKFQKLTAQEEKAELLSSNTIGTRKNWEALLNNQGLKVSGHRLVKAKKPAITD
jgi:DNA phosphorothioation-associated putative methyltransferase